MEENKNTQSRKTGRSWGYAVPFLSVLAILTVASFLIPLRPTRSYVEKRNLAEFPDFSWESLVSGNYFEDISTWFSDTFPGREGWLNVSSRMEELYGISDIYISGDVLTWEEQEPSAPDMSEPLSEETEATEQESTEETIRETIVMEEIEAPTTPVEEWGGVDAGEAENVAYGDKVIQVGDSLFGYMWHSSYNCGQYARMINSYVERTRGWGQDINVVVAPVPTAVGIMVEEEYQEQLHCAPQDAIIEDILANLDESIIPVNMFDTLVSHNSEYIYFRTDHHWTGLGAYYAYTEICKALGMEPAGLDCFEERDQGEFQGSLYYRAPRINSLTNDRVIAYEPKGEISMRIYESKYGGFDWPVVTDMTKSNVNSKYMAFLAGDHALTVITNDSIPDAPNCILVKDSFGNPAAAFFTQNYHNVYVVDYRYLHFTSLRYLVEDYDVSDVIFMNNLSALQVEEVIKEIAAITK